MKSVVLCLAYILQDSEDRLEVADVEDREGQSDMTEMAVALLQRFPTSLTKPSFI